VIHEGLVVIVEAAKQNDSFLVQEHPMTAPGRWTTTRTLHLHVLPLFAHNRELPQIPKVVKLKTRRWRKLAAKQPQLSAIGSGADHLVATSGCWTRSRLDYPPLVLVGVEGEEIGEALGFGAIEELAAVQKDRVVEWGDCEVRSWWWRRANGFGRFGVLLRVGLELRDDGFDVVLWVKFYDVYLGLSWFSDGSVTHLAQLLQQLLLLGLQLLVGLCRGLFDAETLFLLALVFLAHFLSVFWQWICDYNDSDVIQLEEWTELSRLIWNILIYSSFKFVKLL
jgi:hypothetical protein